MKSLVLCLVFILLLCTGLLADISQYLSFVSSTGNNYTLIPPTIIVIPPEADPYDIPLDIGFSFPYGNSSYTQVKVREQGYITLGTDIGTTLLNNLASTTYCPVLAPLWDDTLINETYVDFCTTGSAPNRIFTVQFDNVRWLYNQPNTNFSYQIKLHENGVIDFCYGPGTTPLGACSASIGLNMLPGGISNFISVTPGNPATSSTSVENNTINTYPGVGVIYSFVTAPTILNDLAATSLTGNQTPVQGITSPYSISVRNAGVNTQTNYTVKLMTGTTTLASLSGTPIQAGQTINYTLNWTPAALGTVNVYGKVELQNDTNIANNQTAPLAVVVLPNGIIIDPPPGAYDVLARKPLDFYYKNSLYECVIPNAELGNLQAQICGIQLYNNFVEDRMNTPVKIWIGTTTQPDLANGWIPSTQLTQVYNGTASFPNGTNTVTIIFPTPFPYGNGQNLVFMFNRPMDIQYYSSSNTFQCRTQGTTRSRNAYADDIDFDPANPPATSTLSGQYPRLGLIYLPLPQNQLSGIVTGVNGLPLPDTSIQLDNGASVITNAQGQYVFSNISAGNHTLTASHAGYSNLTDSITMPANGNLVHNISLAYNFLVSITGTVTGNDTPPIPLPNATIILTCANFTANTNTNAQGQFTFTGVPYLEFFEYTVSAPGFFTISDTLTTIYDNTDLDINLVMMVYPPLNLTATLQAGNMVLINWLPPEDAVPVGYNVYVLPEGQEENQVTWTQVAMQIQETQCTMDISALASGDYKWAVLCSYPGGLFSYPVFTNPLAITGAIDPVVIVKTDLRQNYPNPFNPSTTISFDVKDAQPISIRIYNLKGQLVRTLVNETKARGRYEISWNGKDDNGKAVASGIYQYKMDGKNVHKVLRMMMLK